MAFCIVGPQWDQNETSKFGVLRHISKIRSNLTTTGIEQQLGWAVSDN